MRTRRLILLILVLALCTPLLSGCSEILQLEEWLFVTDIALDVVDDGFLQVSVHVPSGLMGSGGSGQGDDKQSGGGSSGSDYMISATGNDLSQALVLLQATLPRRLNYSQVREITCSEVLARSDAMPGLIRQLATLSQMRIAANLSVCRGNASEYLRLQQSYFGARLTEFIDVRLRNAWHFGFTVTTTLSAAIKHQLGEHGSFAASYVAVHNDDAVMPLSDGRTLDALPGNLPRRNVISTESLGAALFRNGRMIGATTGFGTSMTQILAGTIQVIDYQHQNTTYLLSQRRPSKLRVQLQADGRYLLSATVYIDVERSLTSEHAPAEELRAALTQDLLQQISFYQSLSCDIPGFWRQAIRQYATIDQWHALDWPSQFHNAVATVDVHLTELPAL